MTQKPVWTPTLKWHLRVAGFLLLGCTLAYFVLSYITVHLPQPYQPRNPAPETTPWVHK